MLEGMRRKARGAKSDTDVTTQLPAPVIAPLAKATREILFNARLLQDTASFGATSPRTLVATLELY